MFQVTVPLSPKSVSHHRSGGPWVGPATPCYSVHCTWVGGSLRLMVSGAVRIKSPFIPWHRARVRIPFHGWKQMFQQPCGWQVAGWSSSLDLWTHRLSFLPALLPHDHLSWLMAGPQAPGPLLPDGWQKPWAINPRAMLIPTGRGPILELSKGKEGAVSRPPSFCRQLCTRLPTAVGV